MADTFKNILFGFIIVSLFSYLMIGAVIQEGILYDKDTSEVTGSALDINPFNQSVVSVQASAEDLREKFEKQSMWSNVAGVVVTGIFSVAKSMVTMIIYPFTLISNILVNVLHVPMIVVSVILGLLLMSIIFGIWRLIKVGD